MECEGCPLGTYVPEGSLRGCTRKASNDDIAKFEHLHDEVMPFIWQLAHEDRMAALQEMEAVEDGICGSELGRYVDSKGKVM